MLNDEYGELKALILRIGPVVPGHLREVYLRCGRKNCRCRSIQKKNWHGPYIFWDRHDGKKLASRSIPPEHAQAIRSWINNRKKLDCIVLRMHQCGLRMADQLQKFKNKKK